MRNTVADAGVIYVDGDGKHHKGTIADVITQGLARIKLGEDHHAISVRYSEQGEPGTFHYPDQAELVKANVAAAKTAGESAVAADPLDHDHNGKKGGSLPKAHRPATT